MADIKVFEDAYNYIVPPEQYVVVRLDGRNFTSMVKNYFVPPADERFSYAMELTAKHLMDTGFRVPLVVTHSDEISVLIDKSDDTFNRSLRKILSVFAGEASSKFTRIVNQYADINQTLSFDARVSVLPNIDLVSSYYLSRQLSCINNAVSSYAYYMLLNSGMSAQAVTKRLAGVSIDDKKSIIRTSVVDEMPPFEDMPLWYRHGIAIYMEEYEKQGYNPKKDEVVNVTRRRSVSDHNLPSGDDFKNYVWSLVFDDLQ